MYRHMLKPERKILGFRRDVDGIYARLGSTQRRVVIPYRRFGLDRLSRNVGKEDNCKLRYISERGSEPNDV